MPEQAAPWAEPVRQRLRAWRAGQLLLDTRRAHLYFPDDRHPLWAVPAGDLLGPAPGALTHDGLVVLSPGDADTWVEEDRQAYGQPRNPYHRVDALPSSRHVQILAGQAVVAETSRPVLLIETGVAPRWYIPPGDVAIAGYLAAAAEHPRRPHHRRRDPGDTAVNSTGTSAREELFWDLAQQLLVEPGVTRSTMMGYPCLRANGAFFACIERATGNLIVKLPAHRVSELAAAGCSSTPDGRR